MSRRSISVTGCLGKHVTGSFSGSAFDSIVLSSGFVLLPDVGGLNLPLFFPLGGTRGGIPGAGRFGGLLGCILSYFLRGGF